MVASHISGKRLIRDSYTKNSQNSTLKQQSIRKRAKDVKRHFTKDDIQTAHERMFSITSHVGNVNEDHDEVSVHIC